MKKVTSVRRLKNFQEQSNLQVELSNHNESLVKVDLILNELRDNFNVLESQLDKDRKNFLDQFEMVLKEINIVKNDETMYMMCSNIIQKISGFEKNIQLQLSEIQKLSERKIENLTLSFTEYDKDNKKQLSLILDKQNYVIDQIEKINNNFSKLEKMINFNLISDKFIIDVKNINNQLFDQIRTLVTTETGKILKNLLPQKKDIEAERTISYQLGKELIDGAKNIENLFSLPKRLIGLKKENEFRKISKQKNIKDINAQESEKLKISNIKKLDIKELKLDNPKKVESNDYITNPNPMLTETKEILNLNENYPLISYENIKKYWPNQQSKAKFISILDEISHNSWVNEFKLFPLNINNNINQIEGSSSSALFIESCWKGNNGSWEYAFTSPGLKHKNAQKLLESLDTAKNRKLPIIFWNKEDPMHYEKFLPIAEKCDVIFTTDENKIKDYKKDLPNKKVFSLLFAANPYICNPINRNRYEEETICFAGSYYSVGHDDRKDQMDALLPALLEFNGAIYDRMSKLNNERYYFPEKYRHLIRDAVDFKEMSVLYKHFKIFLNVNTITDSPTMMSRRVYELLACGTPVISTPSLALQKQFPDIVQIAKNAEDAVKIAKELLSDEWKYKHLSHKGYREVMLKHTYGHRVHEILNSINITFTENISKVSIIMATMREHYIERIVENISRQNYNNIEVLIVTQNFSKNGLLKLENSLNSLKNLSSYKLLEINEEMTLGERLNKAASFSTGEYLAKMDDDDFYFENYLTDMMIPFSFGNFGLVGKKEIFIYLEGMDKTVLKYYQQGHRVTDFVAGATLVIKKSIFDSVGGFDSLNKSEDSTLIEKLKNNNHSIYAADPFNFIAWRGKDVQNHTWQVTDDFFINSKLSKIFDGFDQAKVIV